MADLETFTPRCVDQLMAEAQGISTEDPANSEVIEQLEYAMVDGANLISTILECKVPGCTREQAITTAAGFISLDVSFDSGQCVQALDLNSIH